MERGPEDGLEMNLASQELRGRSTSRAQSASSTGTGPFSAGTHGGKHSCFAGGQGTKEGSA